MLKKIMFGLVLGIIFYSVLVFYSGFDKVIQAFISFDTFFIVPVILLFFVGVLFEFVRWHYYMHELDLKIGWKESMLIFFSGYATALLPAKSGELVRFYLLKKHKKINLKKSVPIHFVGNLTIFLIVLLFSFPILSLFNISYFWILLIILSLFIAVLIIQNKKVSRKIYHFVKRINFLGDKIHRLKESYASSHSLTRSKPLFFGVLFSFVYYLAWSLSFYFILAGFGVEMNFLLAIAILSFSAIIGVISMLPGGLGAVEGGIFGLLIYTGLAENIAAVSTIVTRFFGFWLLIVLGAVSFALLERKSLIKSQ